MTTTLDPAAIAVKVAHRVQRQPPTYLEVTDRIVAEAMAGGLPIGLSDAVAYMIFLEEAIMAIRAEANRVRVPVGFMSYHIHELDLERFHPLMTIIMPDEAVAAPESAHDLINLILCTGNERALRHTSRGEELVYCAVALDLVTE